MGHARTLSVSLSGLDGTLVEVEADVSPGLPAFSVVGLPDRSTLQARDRVRAASARSGIHLAARRITVNMSPAWRPKHGSGFDLAIAMAVLDAQGDLLTHVPPDLVLLGELGLDGRVRPIPGVLPALLAAAPTVSPARSSPRRTSPRPVSSTDWTSPAPATSPSSCTASAPTCRPPRRGSRPSPQSRIPPAPSRRPAGPTSPTFWARPGPGAPPRSPPPVPTTCCSPARRAPARP